jgi:hypothetical protein
VNYFVYAVRLDERVWSWRKFLKRNKHSQGQMAFYVGSTGVSISDRIKAHMAGNPGKGGNDVVRRFSSPGAEVVCLGAYATRAEAETAEKQEALRIRSLGVGVWSNEKTCR